MLRRLLDFYIHSSLHVSLAIVSLTIITYCFFDLPLNNSVLFFIFSSSVVGYNYTKYNSSLLTKSKISTEYKIIFFLTAICYLLSFGLLLKLNYTSQGIVFATGLLTLLYAAPFGKRKNFRNLSGLKIYIVALCWVSSTLLLPLFEAEHNINTDIIIKSVQRFLLVIILILVFEIIDLKEDNPSLKTVPQTIGIKKTKFLGFTLLVLFFCLEFFLTNYKNSQLLINLALSIVIFLFTLYASEKKSKYYTTFWVESIPILWLLLVIVFR